MELLSKFKKSGYPEVEEHLPSRPQLNMFAHEGEGILNRIQNELGKYNKWSTLENTTAIHAIGRYISDVNLNTEDRIYRNVEKYVNNKLINTLNKIETWIVEEYSATLQTWLEEEFAEDFANQLKEQMKNEDFNVDEDVKTIIHDCVNKYR